ncbi:MAG: hypothetical protein HOV87_24355 [Catenulispora sp.]|nr:hypothetical protein [Catenulispora sp.]
MNAQSSRKDGDGDVARDESPEEKADRNLVELLQELRVLQTGVQIIFAFLLSVAFTPRFTQLTYLQVNVYICALLASVLALAVLAAPVALHRILFRNRQKERIVTLSAQFARVGLLLLALAMTSALFLILDLIRGHVVAGAITGGVAVVFAILWFLFPWALRR